MDEENDGKISMLVSMGFDAPSSRSALESCGGDVERAVERLLGGGGGSGGGGSGVPSAVGGDGRFVRCEASQYSAGPDGRSACTCVALSAADAFLSLSAASSMKGSASSSASGAAVVEECVTPSFLSDAVTSGVEAYRAAKRAAAAAGDGGGAVEHMSAEEVLSGTSAFPNLRVVGGGVRQGVLSNDPSSPLGFRALLEGCRADSDGRWLAVLITKTPETVVCVIPPSDGGGGDCFALIDSHPRPQLVGAGGGSYAAIHGDLDGLVQTLNAVFPLTDLGPDVGEMMAMMYNSFDVYPLQRNEK